MRSKRLILSRSQSEALRLSQALTACGIANTLTATFEADASMRVGGCHRATRSSAGAGLPAPKGKRCVVLGGCQ